MTLADRIERIRSKAEEQLRALNTRERTKHALLLPFLDALGYDVFDVLEVTPTATVSVGPDEEEIDYAINRDGTPIMLFECAAANTDLVDYDSRPFFECLSAAEAKIGVLTNGLVYRFFTDLGEENIGATDPLIEFNLLDYEAEDLRGLEQLRKSVLDVETVLTAACELKYRTPLSRYLNRQHDAPDEEFVQFMAERVYEGEAPESVQVRFRSVVRKALEDFAQGHSEQEANDTASSTDQEHQPTSEVQDDETPNDGKEKEADRGEEGDANREDREEPEEDEPFEKNLAERVVKDFIED